MQWNAQLGNGTSLFPHTLLPPRLQTLSLWTDTPVCRSSNERCLHFPAASRSHEKPCCGYVLIHSELVISTAVMMKLKECSSEESLLTCGFLSFQWLSLVSIKQTECCILCFSILCFCTLAWLFRHFAGNSSSLVPPVHSSKSACKEKQQKSKAIWVWANTEVRVHGAEVDSIFNTISTVSFKHSPGCQGMH